MIKHSHNRLKPTERELEVMNLLHKGYTNKEIARHLELALRTVQHHLETAYRKLEAQNRVEAVIKAQKVGWFTLNNNSEG